MVWRALLITLLLAAAPNAHGDEGEAAVLRDATRPQVGEWVGHVSWNEPIVSYAWTIYPDGTFSSGRLGRYQRGGGAWGVHGGELILKYEDGFRYQGVLSGDGFGGTAYTANGRPYGAFSMWRATENAVIEESP